MRYAQIRSMDVSNGEGIGIALFVQGCHFHCHDCFNPDTWDFGGGKEWTQDTENKFITLASKPYIKRISILGGEPLAEENLDGVLKLVRRINKTFNGQHMASSSSKKIWLYTGYTWGSLFMYDKEINSSANFLRKDEMEFYMKRQQIIQQCNVLVDGRYIDTQKDITLKWRGSRNQRVIDIQKTLRSSEIILYCD